MGASSGPPAETDHARVVHGAVCERQVRVRPACLAGVALRCLEFDFGATSPLDVGEDEPDVGPMRHHQYEIELEFSAARLWALFQRYDLWKEYAPAVLDVEIIYGGDERGNGLLRKVIYPLPFGRRGESYELVTNVRPESGYDYLMLRTGLKGSMSLEPLDARRTRIRFRESFHMTTPVLRWFEAPIYRFINRKNEESIRGAAAWLAAHPEFRADLDG